jgi:hypothetical protein
MLKPMIPWARHTKIWFRVGFVFLLSGLPAQYMVHMGSLLYLTSNGFEVERNYSCIVRTLYSVYNELFGSSHIDLSWMIMLHVCSRMFGDESNFNTWV